MKLQLCGMLLGLLCQAMVYAQSPPKKFSIKLKKEPIKSAIKKIYYATGIRISGPIVRHGICLSVDLQDTSGRGLVERCFEDLPVQLRWEGNYVIAHVPVSLMRKVSGKVTDQRGFPRKDILVETLKGCNSAETQADGSYTIIVQSNETELKFSDQLSRYKIAKIPPNNQLSVVLPDNVTYLQTIVYDFKIMAKIPRGLLIGSQRIIDSAQLAHPVSQDFMRFLQAISPEVTVYNSKPLIRGVSGIHSEQGALIVLNGFPFLGSLSSINTADIENVTILKDAVATSIWGAKASNGVIVIRTRSGDNNTHNQINGTVNFLWSPRPNVFRYKHFITSEQFLESEKFLFNNGAYDDELLNTYSFPQVSPAVEILVRHREHLISDQQAQDQLDSLSRLDVRKDIHKYYYQPSFLEQYIGNLQGGNDNHHFYFSMGLDKFRPMLVKNSSQRFTGSFNQGKNWPKYKLQANSSLMVAVHNENSNNTGFPSTFYPYEMLADQFGNPLEITHQFRRGFADTASFGNLLDWKLRPLNELALANNTQKLTEVFANIQINKQILPKLNLSLAGQLQIGSLTNTNSISPASYYYRNIYNSFIQPADTGYYSPIRSGGINDIGEYKNFVRQLNVRLHLDTTLGKRKFYNLSAALGMELSKQKTETSLSRQYGIGSGNSSPYDNTEQLFPLNYAEGSARIPMPAYNRGTIDNFLSGYLHASLLIKNKLSIIGTIRKDASNLWGSNTNTSGKPLLWSWGMAWQISNYNFYPLKDILPHCRISITDGISSNLSKSITGNTTVKDIGMNPFKQAASEIENPPNENLCWERTRTTNMGIELGSSSQLFNVKMEYFIKKSQNLLAPMAVDYTVGVSRYFGNYAEIQGQGFEVQLSANIAKKNFQWKSMLILSHAKDRVTKYDRGNLPVKEYLQSGQFVPLEGRPYYSLFALPSGPLDHATGNPQLLMDGNTSQNYTEVLSDTAVNKYLLFKGSAIPTYYGSIFNTISFKRFSLAFIIAYKFGYSFRRASIDYSSLYSSQQGHSDYARRWKSPGDELLTRVPSQVYPLVPDRDAFYTFSDHLVEKADHIRLQDLKISYQLTNKDHRRLPFENMQLYLYGNNLGILWCANRSGLDPDYPEGLAPAVLLGAGLKIGIKQ